MYILVYKFMFNIINIYILVLIVFILFAELRPFFN